MKIIFVRLFLSTLLVATAVAQTGEKTPAVSAATTPISRPAIVGVARIALRTDDIEAARRFYTGILGFEEPFTIHWPVTQGGGVKLTYFEVNPHQSIEVIPKLPDPKMDRLAHISFETKDAEQLRLYLASKGVQVPDKLDVLPDGNHGFKVLDPDGHKVEFLQLLPGSLYTRNFAKHLKERRVSRRILHVGVVIKDRAAADHFYKDILGFKPIWHGGMKDEDTDWVDMRVPEGTDWLEYMLNVHDPDPQELGVMHHVALGVASVKAGYKATVARGYKPSEKPEIGRDGKWQFNLYDPNLTRVELMEPKPVRKPCCSPILK